MKGSGSVILALDDLQWLRRFAAMLTRDADEADDLVQETLVVAWASPPRDTGAPARPWLATVLRNLFRMQRRAGARREQREGLGSSASTTTVEPERELARLEVLRILLAELDRLAPGDQKILVRRFFEGESAAEIGEFLRVPAATVRSRIHRSLQRLRDALDRRFGDRSAWSVAVLIPSPPMTAAQPVQILSQGGSSMSITAKVTIAATASALAVTGWLGLPEGPALSVAASKEPVEAVVSAPAPSTPKAAWEQRRSAIRQRLPPRVAAPAPLDDRAELQREHDDFGVLKRACLDDLGDGKSGAVTLSVTKIGAPDVGTIYDDVEIVETTYEDKEVLQCLIESMVSWVGEAPAEPFERRETRTFVLGEVTADVKDQRQFEFIIGAHINEVRWCEARGQPDAAAVSGRARVAFTIADDPEGKTRSRTAVVGDTELAREVVDCIITASQRWIFPAAMRGRTFEYGFVLPVAGRPPR